MDHGKYTELVKAAIEIERLSMSQEDRTKALQKLASDVKKGELSQQEIKRRRSEIDASLVTDFGGGVADLIRALKKVREQYG